MVKERTHKIRILYFIGQLDYGGSERQLVLLLKNLDRKAFKPRVIVFNQTDEKNHKDTIQSLGIKVITIPLNRTSIISRIRYLYSQTKLFNPDIIHSWTVHDNPYAGILRILTATKVSIGSLRGGLKYVGFRSLPMIFRFLSLYSVSKLVVNSIRGREEFSEFNLPANHIVVIPNCVEDRENGDTSSVLSNYGFTEHHKIIGIVGNVRKRKNHLMFIRAMESVLKSFPKAKAIIIGQQVASEPDLADSLKREIKKLNIQNQFVFAGFRRDISAIMKELEIFCLTSSKEGMPNVILEAMAAGRPVVATQVGGVPDLVVDGDNGLLVDSGDVKGFSQAVKYLLENPTIANKMGNRGKQMASKRFGCQKTIDEFETLYLSLMHGRRSIDHSK